MVELSARERARAESFEPRFWRRAEDADEKQGRWFESLLNEPNAAAFVSGPPEATTGYVIAMLVDAPPVYAPEGKTCMIDDYEYATPHDGHLLREAVEAWAIDHGAVQTVVVAPREEAERRALLEAAGFHVVSEWWLRPLP